MVESYVRDYRESFSEQTLRSVFRAEDVPGTAPAFGEIWVDGEGNLWVKQVIKSDSTRTTWDVFDARGSWLGPSVLVGRAPEWGHQVWGRRELYRDTEDEEGRPVVIRYRIVAPVK